MIWIIKEMLEARLIIYLNYQLPYSHFSEVYRSGVKIMRQ